MLQSPSTEAIAHVLPPSCVDASRKCMKVHEFHWSVEASSPEDVRLRPIRLRPISTSSNFEGKKARNFGPPLPFGAPPLVVQKFLAEVENGRTREAKLAGVELGRSRPRSISLASVSVVPASAEKTRSEAPVTTSVVRACAHRELPVFVPDLHFLFETFAIHCWKDGFASPQEPVARLLSKATCCSTQSVEPLLWNFRSCSWILISPLSIIHFQVSAFI